MGKCGNIWENMGKHRKHGKIWENMGKPGETWGNRGKIWGNMGKYGQNLGIWGGASKVTKSGPVPCPRSSESVCKFWIFIPAFSKHGSEVSEPQVRFGVLCSPWEPSRSFPDPSPSLGDSVSFLEEAWSVLINPREPPGDLRAGKSFGDKSLFQRLIKFNWINPFSSGIIFCSHFVQLVPETSQVLPEGNS